MISPASLKNFEHSHWCKSHIQKSFRTCGNRMDILFEDNHLLVINKAAGWIVQGAQPGQRSIIAWAANYLRTKYSKPGNVYVGIVSRLDAPVTGVLPLARTSKAASRLSDQIRRNTVVKVYWAMVEHSPPKPSDRLEHHLLRRESDTVSRVLSSASSETQLAILDYRVLEECSQGTRLEISLVTGRKHQIRAQMSAIGCPIVGDAKYGSKLAFPSGIALHCRRICFKHPTLPETCDFVAPLPQSWA